MDDLEARLRALDGKWKKEWMNNWIEKSSLKYKLDIKSIKQIIKNKYTFFISF